MALVLARVFIGWYMLYEGLSKLFNPTWSAYSYLLESKGWFAPLFQGLAANETILKAVNFLNVWGLIAVGLGLILGLLTRWATLGGMALIGLYILSHPAVIDAEYFGAAGNPALWIDRNLVFAGLLLVLFVFPTGSRIGLDRLLFNRRKSC